MASKCTEVGKWQEAKRRSLATQKRMRDERKAVYYLDPVRCYCSNVLPFEKRKTKYCSRACAVRKNNEKRHSGRKCVVCLNLLDATQKKTCSMECRGKNLAAIMLARFVRAEISCAATLRKILLKIRPHQCEDCKLSVWKGQPIPIDVDHIDGDSANNIPANLRLLCKNCHGLTPTFGNRNIGRGRKARYMKKSLPHTIL